MKILLLTLALFFSNPALAFTSSFEIYPKDAFRGKVAEGAIAMGFVSKEMCSCLFVEKNSKEYCDEYIMIDGLEEIKFKVTVDKNNRTVRASTGLVIIKKAKYIDDKRGCTQTQ